MIIIYNILLFIFLILFSPLIFVKIIISPKYRGRIPERLGFGLDRLLAEHLRDRPDPANSIWIHALSVGEVLSAQPLVKEIRAAFPKTKIIFSASTMTGEILARQTLKKNVDLFVPFPLDLFCSVKYFLRRLQPDLFILIETDFWPNFIHYLNKQDIPSLLINGRISSKSYARYKRLRFFFLPLFSSFRFISMQTAADAEKMINLGVSASRVRALGNLKYDAVMVGKDYWQTRLKRPVESAKSDLGIPPARTIWIAGSTHPGEETIIFTVFKRLFLLFPDLFLIVAPRQVERGREVMAAAQRLGLTCHRRSKPQTDDKLPTAPVLILDTMGELSEMYEFCDIAFIGGSLVPDGGHNPLEPAAYGKAVIFGPHMDDFTEITRDLLDNKAALVCSNEEELFTQIQSWLADPAARENTGLNGLALVNMHQGVTARHVELISGLLKNKNQD